MNRPVHARNLCLVCMLMFTIGMTNCRKNDDAAIEEKTSKSDGPSAVASTTAVVDVEKGGRTASFLPAATVMSYVGLVNPGAVIVDEEADVYLVSNSGPEPMSKDNSGFISRIRPDGTILDLKWIEGGKNDVMLTSPKGIAIRDNILYVADINRLRKFDKSSGKPMGEILFENAGYLNDIALSDDGILYVTDTGLKPISGRLVANDTDCIFRVDKDEKVSEVLRSKALKQPNGLIVDKDRFYVVSYSMPLLLSVTMEGEVKEMSSIPGDRLDGIVLLPDGRLLVTSWRSSSVLIGAPNGPFTIFKENVQGPGDLTLDRKRNQIVVPAAKENSIYIQPLNLT